MHFLSLHVFLLFYFNLKLDYFYFSMTVYILSLFSSKLMYLFKHSVTFFFCFNFSLLNICNLFCLQECCWALISSSWEWVRRCSVNVSDTRSQVEATQQTSLFNKVKKLINHPSTQAFWSIESWQCVVVPHWLGMIRTSDSAYCLAFRKHHLVIPHQLGISKTSDSACC